MMAWVQEMLSVFLKQPQKYLKHFSKFPFTETLTLWILMKINCKFLAYIASLSIFQPYHKGPLELTLIRGGPFKAPPPIKTHLEALLAQFFHITLIGVGDKDNLWKYFCNRFLSQKMPFLHTFSLTCDNSGFSSEIWKSDKTSQNVPKTVHNHWIWILVLLTTKIL